VKDWSFLLVVSIYAGIPYLVFSATEHGIFSGRWEIDLTLKEHQKVEAVPKFELVLFGIWGPRATEMRILEHVCSREAAELVCMNPTYGLFINVDPADVRLQPGVEGGYEWKPLPGKENLHNEGLFTKQLSKHSLGAYMELYRGLGVSFQAAVMVPCKSGERRRSSAEHVSVVSS
jgi:hypothetical protein